MGNAGPSNIVVGLSPRAVTRVKSEDRALIRAARRGSPEAAEALASRYWDDAYKAAFYVLGDASGAEDVAQEALLSALASLPRFQLARPFGPWLHRIAVNAALDQRRARERRAEHLAGHDDYPDQPISGDGQTITAFEGPLATALADLQPEDRAIVVLRHVWNYNAAEIGRMLGLSPSTVRTRLQRALTGLRLALAPLEEEK